MTLPDFIADCDAFCREFGVSRVWLSKRLFSDTFRLEALAAGGSDVGVLRLQKARTDLADLRKARVGAHGGSPADPASVAPSGSRGASAKSGALQ